MTTAVVTSKGQIVIPVRFRRKFNIKRGAKLFVEEKGDSIMLKPMSPDYFDRMAGVLTTKGKLTKRLLEDRAKEREREG